MSKPTSFQRRVAAVVATTLAGAGLAFATPSAAEAAGAGHGKLGPVQNLAASATKPGAKYVVHASWSKLAGATAYAVTVSNASGVRIAAAKTTGLSYDASTNLTVGAKAVVKVVPYATTKPGRPASRSLVMPDVTAPSAAYTVLSHGTSNVVTVQRDSLSDDLTPQGSITQTIDWDGDDDTLAPEPWPVGDLTITHTYPSDKKLYYPTVTVTDQAHNSATHDLTVAVADSEAPVGSYSVATPTAWARYTKVSLKDNGATDDLSAPEHITRSVSWGDGTAPQAWHAGTTPTHVYQVGGTFTPSVTLIDEAGNPASAVDAGTVNVAVDRTAPVTKFRSPMTRRTKSPSWRTVGGTATDAGVGVRLVKVKVIEKRNGAWYAYKPATRTWVKTATKAGALKRAGTANVKPSSTHAWKLSVKGLRAGVVVVRASGLDRVGNASTWVVRKQTLRG